MKKKIFILIIILFISFHRAYAELSSFEELKKSVEHFGKIEDGLYRSGQIYADTITDLKILGIKTVVSFNDDQKKAEEENRFLKTAGINFYWMPWQAFDQPQDEMVDQVLVLMSDPKLKPMLIHCQRGSDRTGLMSAAYRIAKENWTLEQALQEMRQYDFHEFQFGHLKQYLYDFYQKQGHGVPQKMNPTESLKNSVLSNLYKTRKFFKLIQ